MLVHFKIETCSSVNIPSVCAHVFGDLKHLAVLHTGKNENPHWHCQGETPLDGKELDSYLKDVCTNHSKYIKNPKARPCKRAKKDIDESGYQYIMKEGVDSVVHRSDDFTDDVLLELFEQSNEHVDKLKNQLRDYLIEKEQKFPSPEEEAETKVHTRWRIRAAKFYVKNKKMPPPNFQKLLVWIMLNHFKADSEMFEYLSGKL